MITNELKNDTIIIVKNNKNNLIKQISAQPLLNIKYMTFKEIREKLYFSYDEKTIHYLITKYNYNYDVAQKYIDNLYYIETNTYNDSKLTKLLSLKEELQEKKLISQNKLFQKSLTTKNIIIYNPGQLSKFDQKLINHLQSLTKVQIYNEPKKEYHPKYIYQFDTLEEEVAFTVNSICNLLKQNISPNHIKICGINQEYHNPIKKIFTLHNIPITLEDNKLYATKIAKDFLNHLDKDLNITLKYLEENYNLKNEHIKELYNNIITIINKYAWCENILTCKEMLIHDFKNKQINKTKLQEKVEFIDNLNETNDEDYIFLMNLNQGSIPQTYKDEDYLNNHQKELLEIDTTNDLNKLTTTTWINNIKKCKNLTISCKKASPTGQFYVSSLNDILNLEIKHPTLEYTHSNIYNQIELTKDIDTLIKYNTKNPTLEILYQNYQNIPYLTYNHDYQKINPTNLKKYLNNKLTLSYSALNNYYHCSFKYYLSNILNLNIYETTFNTFIGNLFHYILSICFEKDINLKETYNEYITNQTDLTLSSKELFFLQNLFEELNFVINTIKKQYQYTSLNKNLYEEKITINKSRDDMMIIFKGFVDKIMLDTTQQLATIIDYKTGTPNINLNNTIYGLDLQLPVYIYLTTHKFPNIRIIGFYLQKILNTNIPIDNKNTYEAQKEDKLKLQGYTNSDETIIPLLDKEYHNSKVIKGMKTSSKGLSTKKILTDTQINKLTTITEEKIDEAITNILNADFTINPKKVGMTNIGCQFCTYKDICYTNESDLINLKEYKNMEFLEE